MSRLKITLGIVILLAVAALLWWQADRNAKARALAERPMAVTTFDVPTQSTGGLTRPGNFPRDLPVLSKLTESSYTRFDQGGATQGSVGFETNKPFEETYRLYKDYLASHEYTVSETRGTEGVRSLAGTKSDANLNVVLSQRGESVYVQLSYLFFGQ